MRHSWVERSAGEVLPDYGEDGLRAPLMTSMAVQPRGMGAGGAPQEPSVNLSDPERRAKRMAQKAVIPAGYTYLAQLIGHDAGNSVSLDLMPHSNGAILAAQDAARDARRYDLIENPLTMETVYGKGPTLLHHLYDPRTFLFRVEKGLRVSPVFSMSGSRDESVRALYDSRNRDTTFLHRLAVIWMKFHNYLALAYQRSLGLENWGQRGLIYARVRAHVLSVWHDVIRHDLLPTFVNQDTLPRERRGMPVMGPATLLHGVFRAFHALPRGAYFMDGQMRPLAGILRTHVTRNPRADDWTLQWENFFTQTEKGTKTGMTATVSEQLTGSAGLPLAKLDLRTAQSVSPLRLGDETLKQAVKVLTPEHAARLEPARFAADVNAHLGLTEGPELLTADKMDWMPLYVTLMLEADLYGQDGRFGPFGGLLLTHMLEQRLDAVVGARPLDGPMPRPQSMYEVIQYVEARERDQND